MSTADGQGPDDVDTVEEQIPETEEEELDATEAAEIEEVPPTAMTFEQLVAQGHELGLSEVKRVLQSLLLVSDRPLDVLQMRGITGLSELMLGEALAVLAQEFRDGVSGIVLTEVAGGWQLRTDPASAEYVRRLLQVKPQRLTRPALETMAVIAYRQPVTRPEIEEIRGVDCGAVLKALLERRLVKILGKKEDVGRPLLYGTTREFLEFFALKDLTGLPTLQEFHELSEEHQALVARKEAPRPTPAGTVEALADPAFEARMDAQRQASEDALELLEEAISTADSHARAAVEALRPKDVEAPKSP